MGLTRAKIDAWKLDFTEVSHIEVTGITVGRMANAMRELIAYFEETEERKAFNSVPGIFAPQAGFTFMPNNESTPAERRRYALLQAAATMYGPSTNALPYAMRLLEEIERLEREEKP